MILLLLACEEEAPPQAEPRFVRDGAILEGPPPAGAVPLTGARSLVNGAWSSIPALQGRAEPLAPECLPLFSVTLEDLSRLASLQAPAPGAALAFSPDGSRLAIGSFGGSLRIVDGWNGTTLVEKHLSEGLVKQVLWSGDGKTLFIGEQSPDATLAALDADTLQTRWSMRLADDLGSSPMPPPEDIYGPYALPGVYSLQMLPDESLLAVGTHGWVPAGGKRENRSRLYHVRADGKLLEAWPPAGTADAVILHPVMHGGHLLASLSRSADGPAPPGLPIGGVALFDLDPLHLRWGHQFQPLKPHFNEVFIWEGLGLGENRVLAGLGDGRAFLLDSEGNEQAVLTPGVPVLSQGVPIATGVGFASIYAGNVYLLTTETNIPYGSADPMARPPAAHPAQNTVWAYDPDGKPLWHRQMEQALAGIVFSTDGQELLVSAGERTTDTRSDLYGAVILNREDGKVRTVCSTEGPAWFRPTYGSDGRRIAVTESPFLKDGVVAGAYRVTVFR